MNKHWLYNHSRLTRFSDQPSLSNNMGPAGGGGGGIQIREAPSGTGDSGTPANNTGGNPGDQTGAAGGTQNNTGTAFDPKSFWAEPAPAGGANNTGTSTTTPEDTGKEFATRLQNLQFGDVFNKEIGEQIASGDLTGANKSFSDQLRSATQHSVVMAAQLMQKNNDAIMARVEAAIEAKFGGRDNDSVLEQTFAMAKDPALKPVVQGVFNQAMKLAKGNREEAVKSTREMLKYMGHTGAADMGITTPPAGQGDTVNGTGVQELLDSLLGRS